MVYNYLGRADEAAQTFVKLGVPAQALEQVKAAAQADPEHGIPKALFGILVKASEWPCTPNTTLGLWLRSVIGDMEGALACLEQGYENNTLMESAYLRVGSVWAPLREDPRSQPILEAIYGTS